MAKRAFGSAIRARRRELNLGQAELAARLDVSQQAVSRWERGLALPPPRRVTELAAVLDLDANTLMAYAGYLRFDEGAGPPDRPHPDQGPFAELSDDELLALIERAWLELRSRRSITLPDSNEIERSNA